MKWEDWEIVLFYILFFFNCFLTNIAVYFGNGDKILSYQEWLKDTNGYFIICIENLVGTSKKYVYAMCFIDTHKKLFSFIKLVM